MGLKNNKRVLVQTDSFAMGGAEKYLTDISDEIIKNFAYVDFVCLENEKVNELSQCLADKGCKVTRIKSNYYINFFEIIKLAYLIKRTDVVFINKINPAKSLLVILLAILYGKKIVCIEHLNIEIVSKYFLKPPILKWIIKKLMNRVDHIVAISKQSKLFFESYYKYNPDLIEVIYNGVSLPNDRDKKDRSFLDHKIKKIILVGRYCHQKNQLKFLDLINDLRSEIDLTNVIFEFWGGGEQKLLIEEKILDLKLDSNVKVMGFSSNKDDIFRNKYCLVIPSKSEGFPFAMLEAASYSLPIIAFDVGGISDFITHNKNGYLIAAENYEQFKMHLKKLILNEGLCKKMAFNTFENVRDNFTEQHMTSAVISLIKS